MSAPAYHPRMPVICVGNFTAGGTGKTPLTMHLTTSLTAAGRRAAILTRGYGGSTRGPHWVDPDSNSAALVGDEPLLLARTAPTLVCRDRALGARTIETDARGFDVLLMDDGLQNPALAKTLTLAVVDGARGFGNGHVIPAGPMRAPLSLQLERTDAIVVNLGSSIDEADSLVLQRLNRDFNGPVLAARVAVAGETTWLTEKPILAYAGIGAPHRFFDLLERHGARIVERAAFPDHHAFTETDAGQLLQRAKSLNALLATTEKDLARLSGSSGRLGDLANASHALAIRLAFSAKDTLRLAALIDPILTH
jgi:tetraacyldisaccharide 4'-kinase